MAEPASVVVITHGADHELSSVEVAGSSVMHERIKSGAATFSF